MRIVSEIQRFFAGKLILLRGEKSVIARKSRRSFSEDETSSQ